MQSALKPEHRAYKDKYGNLTIDLYETITQANPDDEIEIAVWSNIDREAAKDAADTQNPTSNAERKEAISAEIRKRATKAASELSVTIGGIAGVDVKEVGSALPCIVAVAAPTAIEEIRHLDGI